SNPNIDLTNIIKEIASNPNIDLTNIIKEITSNPNIDLTSLLSGSGLSIIDIIGIMGMFTGGDKYSISSADVTKYYTQYTTFKVTVMNGNKVPSLGTVIFTVDNNRYAGHIRSDGVASVKIKNLKPGTHYIISEYSQTVVKNTITVKKSIITKNVSKKYKKAGQFKVKILNSKGKAYSKQSVKIKFKGKTYTIKTKSNGIATFKLPKNLKVGKYTIKTTYQGLTVTNKITVKK
uniref:Ig-like domain-containing protein n=1 Tax=Methanobrevibacter sp. TaxID=66852 RepID=UPI00386B9781